MTVRFVLPPVAFFGVTMDKYPIGLPGLHDDRGWTCHSNGEKIWPNKGPETDQNLGLGKLGGKKVEM